MGLFLFAPLGYGVYKGIKGKKKLKKAKKLRNHAQEQYEKQHAAYQDAQKKLEQEICDLSSRRVETMAGVVSSYIDVMKPFLSMSHRQLKPLHMLSANDLNFESIRCASLKAKNVLALGLFTACTSQLPILAPFAMGPMGPILGGFMINKQGKKAYRRAKEYAARVDVGCGEMELMMSKLQGVVHYIHELTEVIGLLSEMLEEYVSELRDMSPDACREDYFTQGYLIAKTLCDVCQIQIFDEDIQIREDFVHTMMDAHDFIEQIAS